MSGLRERLIGGAAGGLHLALRTAGVGKAKLPADPQRVLVVKPCCIGDLLFTTPLLAAISEHWRGAEIDYVAGPHAHAALEGNPRLSQIVDAGVVGASHYPAGAVWRLAGQLRRRRYAAAFVPDRSPALALLTLLARIPYRSGLDSRGRGIGLTCAVTVDDRQPRHEVDIYLDVARAAGLPLPSVPRLEYYPTAEAQVQATTLLQSLNLDTTRPIITINPAGGINPGANRPDKRWPADRWRQLAADLSASATVLLIGGPDDRELAATVATNAGVHNVAGRLNLSATAALFQHAALHLGGDTGTTHLAVAVGCRTVGIFGPTSVLRYGLYGPAAQVLNLYPVGAQAGDGSTADVSLAMVQAAVAELLGDL